MSTTEGFTTTYLNSNFEQKKAHVLAAETRMLELKEDHVIRQIHTLPFSYLSQIYHLLNLKHLETIHGISLGSLKVIDVCNFQPTALGGTIQFKTVLDSPINLLRIWRQPIVDVELTLHSPYMVELNIPLYRDKRMIVIFNVLPLSNVTHEFSIDIYTNVKFPKFLLSIILHLAALITLYEDLPYLRKLSKRDLDKLLSPAKKSTHKNMWLFKRFVNLYMLEN